MATWNSKFLNYLNEIGAEHLPLTNEFERVRFIADEIICIVYQGKKGLSFSGDKAKYIYNCFLQNKKINISGTRRERFEKQIKDKLFERDGYNCFYTGKKMTHKTATIEHLIPISKGGTNNMHNLVLCVEKANKFVGDKTLIEKIKYREKNHKEQGGENELG